MALKPPYAAHMKYFPTIMLFVLLTSCYPKSRILNWYSKQEVKADTTITGRVKVFGFAFPGDPGPSKDFWTLPEGAQRAYIKEVGKDVTKPEQLAAAIALPFRKSNAAPFVDLSTFKKKLVFTVMHRAPQPADRIAGLELRLVLPESSGYAFSTWDKIVTQYSTVELGTLSLTGTNTFKLAPEITLAGDILGTAPGELSRVEAMTEEAKLAKRYIEVNGSLSEDQAWLTLNGMPGRDLAGNVVAEITMRATNTASFVLFEFVDLFKDGIASKPENVKLGEVWLKVPYSRNSVEAIAQYDVCVRHVVRRAKTIAEGDDKVQLVCTDSTMSDTIRVIDGSEFDVKIFYLINKLTNAYLGLQGTGTGGNLAPVALRTLEEAMALQRWLRMSASTQVEGTLLQWTDGTAVANYAIPDASHIILEEHSLQPKYEGKFFTVE